MHFVFDNKNMLQIKGGGRILPTNLAPAATGIDVNHSPESTACPDGGILEDRVRTFWVDRFTETEQLQQQQQQENQKQQEQPQQNHTGGEGASAGSHHDSNKGIVTHFTRGEGSAETCDGGNPVAQVEKEQLLHVSTQQRQRRLQQEGKTADVEPGAETEAIVAAAEAVEFSGSCPPHLDTFVDDLGTLLEEEDDEDADSFNTSIASHTVPNVGHNPFVLGASVGSLSTGEIRCGCR